MKTIRSKMLKAARSLATRDWERPQVIKLARDMAHQGASVERIVEALGWEITLGNAVKRLRKYNIRPRPAKRHCPHLGDMPYLSKSQSRTGTIDTRSYVAERMEKAQ